MARRRYRHGYRSYGRSRALQHIEEARRLSGELGGTDKDVKKYFFALSANGLRQILDLYEGRYGREARQYAEEALPKWRSGRVTMSGMVASRLFALLPPQMPLEEKYRLTENLWHHFGPRSKKTLRIGVEAEVDEIIRTVRQHIEDVVLRYQLPEHLERRFEWLASGDVNVKQQILNHFQQLEKSVVVEGARLQVPVLLDHLHEDGRTFTHRAAQILRIGNHEIELIIDRRQSGVVLEEPSGLTVRSPLAFFQGRNLQLIWWVIGALIVWYLLTR